MGAYLEERGLSKHILRTGFESRPSSPSSRALQLMLFSLTLPFGQIKLVKLMFSSQTQVETLEQRQLHALARVALQGQN